MIYRTSKDKLISARKRRLNRKPKGSASDYIYCITKEYLEFKTRRIFNERNNKQSVCRQSRRF